MTSKFARAIAAGLVAFAVTGIPSALAATAFVDFETNPALSQGPSIYVAVPSAQTIVTAPATFSGGVVLGLATFFPAISFASSPNVYGTADFGNNLARTLSIDINPTFATTQVSFALFNGETFNQTYTINAFNGSSLVASQTLTNVAPNFNSGYGLVDLSSAGGITRVTVDAAGNPPVWDFLIDDVAFNQSITNVITSPLPPVVQPATPSVDAIVPIITVDADGHKHRQRGKDLQKVQINFGDDINDIQGTFLVVTTPVPEPESYAMLLAGLGMIGCVVRRRQKKAA